jgi:hypothetical protein
MRVGSDKAGRDRQVFNGGATSRLGWFSGTLWLLIGVLGVPLAAQENVSLPSRAIPLRSGESRDIYLNLGADNRQDVEIKARLALEEPWPDRKRLNLGIVHASSQELGMDTVLRYVPGGRVLWLQAHADRCAPEGTYRAHVDVMPVGQDQTGAGKPVRIPLVVEVAGSSACTVSYAKTALFTLPMALSLFFMLTFVTHTRRLSIAQLAERLQPLYWGPNGEPKPYEASERVGYQITGRLGFAARARSWLSENPIKFSLPGRTYEETFEIRLGPRLEHLTVWVVPPQVARACWENRVGGRLFAKADARGGLSLFCVLDEKGQLWGLTAESKPSLESGRELKQQLDLKSSNTGQSAAGWRLHRVSVRTSRRSGESFAWEARQ